MFEKINTMKRMLQCVNNFKNVIIFFNKWIIYVIIFAELSNELLII